MPLPMALGVVLALLPSTPRSIVPPPAVHKNAWDPPATPLRPTTWPMLFTAFALDAVLSPPGNGGMGIMPPARVHEYARRGSALICGAAWASGADRVSSLLWPTTIPESFTSSAIALGVVVVTGKVGSTPNKVLLLCARRGWRKYDQKCGHGEPPAPTNGATECRTLDVGIGHRIMRRPP